MGSAGRRRVTARGRPGEASQRRRAREEEKLENGDEHRAGFCALVGRPNVGKSTLFNLLVGEPIAIVTPKPQTTRRRLRGIWSGEDGQIVFVDTPGRMEPRYPLQEAMRAAADRAAADADVVLWVVDVGYSASLDDVRPGPPEGDAPAVLCLNKADRIGEDERDRLVGELSEAGWSVVVPTVGTEGKGVERLRREVLERMPSSPPLYPTDQLATDPVRSIVAAFVREACFEQLDEEVPYSVEVQVEQFREEDEPLYISASVYVERSSQKGIVIGEGGRRIRSIGAAARRRIEAFVGRQVYLDLRVKVLHKWRRKRRKLARLGYRLPEQGEDR